MTVLSRQWSGRGYLSHDCEQDLLSLYYVSVSRSCPLTRRMISVLELVPVKTHDVKSKTQRFYSLHPSSLGMGLSNNIPKFYFVYRSYVLFCTSHRVSTVKYWSSIIIMGGGRLNLDISLLVPFKGRLVSSGQGAN